jgi:hypothetical protein
VRSRENILTLLSHIAIVQSDPLTSAGEPGMGLHKTKKQDYSITKSGDILAQFLLQLDNHDLMRRLVKPPSRAADLAKFGKPRTMRASE